MYDLIDIQDIREAVNNRQLLSMKTMARLPLLLNNPAETLETRQNCLKLVAASLKKGDTIPDLVYDALSTTLQNPSIDESLRKIAAYVILMCLEQKTNRSKISTTCMENLAASLKVAFNNASLITRTYAACALGYTTEEVNALPDMVVYYLEDAINDPSIARYTIPVLHRILSQTKHGLTENSFTALSHTLTNCSSSLKIQTIELMTFALRNQGDVFSKPVLDVLATLINEKESTVSNICLQALAEHLNHLSEFKTLPRKLIKKIFSALNCADTATEALIIVNILAKGANELEKERIREEFLNIPGSVLLEKGELGFNETAMTERILEDALVDTESTIPAHILEEALQVYKEQKASGNLMTEGEKNDDIDSLDSINLSSEPTTPMLQDPKSNTTGERTVDELLLELQKNPEINVSALKNQYEAVMDAALHDSKLLTIGKEIKSWWPEDCTRWAEELNKQQDLAQSPEFIAEMIAVISRGNALKNGHEPRSIQQLSLLLMLDAKNSGRLAQVATGEGKTTIVAMLAAIKALQGQKVDVVSSSSVLASRDAASQEAFFNLFKLTVADNAEQKNGERYQKGLKPCYLADVVYGDVANFQWDALRTEYLLEGTRGDKSNERPYNTVIVDEVDSMLIDDGAKNALLGGRKPAMEHLLPLLTSAWSVLRRINTNAHFSEENGHLFWQATPDSERIEVADKAECLRTILENYLIDLISEADSPILIPPHLKPFALSQAEHWAKSAVMASEQFTLGKDYVITIDDDGQKIIAPVDYLNTGVTHAKSSWTNGLHQFLQLKEGVKLTPETITSSFLSNLSYFNRYKTNIYGMTGTLGEKDSQDLLKQAYPLDLVFIPTYKQKNFIEEPGVLAKDHDEWIASIVASVQEETKAERAVLVICESINAVQEIEQALKQANIKNIKPYSRSDTDERLAISGEIQSGDVIVATALAGRGTDIKTSKNVEKKGGLHVCLTYLPNQRGKEQAFGRTSRQGNLGTAQLIVNKEAAELKLNAQYFMLGNADFMENLLQWQADAEHSRLEEIKLFELEKIIIQDKLFKCFCQFKNDTIRTISEDSNRWAEVEEQWGFWLKTIDNRMNKDQWLDVEAIMDEFELFKQQALQDFTQQTIRNPSHWVKMGNHFRDCELYEEAIDAYSKAIAQDSVFSIQALYNCAETRILQKAAGYKAQAAQDLAAARERIENKITPQLDAADVLYQLSQDENAVHDNDVSQQHLNKVNLLRKEIESIDTIRYKLQNAPDDVDFDVNHHTGLSSFFADEDIPYAEINELSDAGLTHLFDIEEAPDDDDDDVWGPFAVAVLGFCQIVVGVCLTLTGNVALGGFFIEQGIGDMVFAVRSAIEGSFSWDNYRDHKVISIAISAATWGINAASATMAAKTGTQVAKEAAKELGKDGLMALAKQNIMHGILAAGFGEVVNLGLNALSRHALACMKDEIDSNVQKELFDHFNDPAFEKAIDTLLVTDKNRYLNELKQLADRLIHPKQNRMTGISSAIINGVLANQSSGPASKNTAIASGISALVTLGSIADAASKVSYLCDNFCEAFKERVIYMAHRLPSQTAPVDKSVFAATRTQLYQDIANMVAGAVKSNLHRGVFRPALGTAMHKQINKASEKMHQAVHASVFETKKAIDLRRPKAEKSIQADNTLALLGLSVPEGRLRKSERMKVSRLILTQNKPRDPYTGDWNTKAQPIPKWPSLDSYPVVPLVHIEERNFARRTTDNVVDVLRNPSAPFIKGFFNKGWEILIESANPPNPFATDIEKAQWRAQMRQVPKPNFAYPIAGVKAASKVVGNILNYCSHPIDAIHSLATFTWDGYVELAFPYNMVKLPADRKERNRLPFLSTYQHSHRRDHVLLASARETVLTYERSNGPKQFEIAGELVGTLVATRVVTGKAISLVRQMTRNVQSTIQWRRESGIVLDGTKNNGQGPYQSMRVHHSTFKTWCDNGEILILPTIKNGKIIGKPMRISPSMLKGQQQIGYDVPKPGYTPQPFIPNLPLLPRLSLPKIPGKIKAQRPTAALNRPLLSTTSSGYAFDLVNSASAVHKAPKPRVRMAPGQHYLNQVVQQPTFTLKEMIQFITQRSQPLPGLTFKKPDRSISAAQLMALVIVSPVSNIPSLQGRKQSRVQCTKPWIASQARKDEIGDLDLMPEVKSPFTNQFHNTTGIEEIYVPLPSAPLHISSKLFGFSVDVDVICREIDRYVDDVMRGFSEPVKQLLHDMYYHKKNVDISQEMLLSTNVGGYAEAYHIPLMVKIDSQLAKCPIFFRMTLMHELIHIGQAYEWILKFGPAHFRSHFRVFAKFTEQSVTIIEKQLTNKLPIKAILQQAKYIPSFMIAFQLIADVFLRREMSLTQYIQLQHRGNHDNLSLYDHASFLSHPQVYEFLGRPVPWTDDLLEEFTECEALFNNYGYDKKGFGIFNKEKVLTPEIWLSSKFRKQYLKRKAYLNALPRFSCSIKQPHEDCSELWESFHTLDDVRQSKHNVLLYVITIDGELLIAPEQIKDEIYNHSDFIFGNDALAVGRIYLEPEARMRRADTALPKKLIKKIDTFSEVYNTDIAFSENFDHLLDFIEKTFITVGFKEAKGKCRKSDVLLRQKYYELLPNEKTIESVVQNPNEETWSDLQKTKFAIEDGYFYKIASSAIQYFEENPNETELLRVDPKTIPDSLFKIDPASITKYSFIKIDDKIYMMPGDPLLEQDVMEQVKPAICIKPYIQSPSNLYSIKITNSFSVKTKPNGLSVASKMAAKAMLVGTLLVGEPNFAEGAHEEFEDRHPPIALTQADVPQNIPDELPLFHQFHSIPELDNLPCEIIHPSQIDSTGLTKTFIYVITESDEVRMTDDECMGWPQRHVQLVRGKPVKAAGKAICTNGEWVINNESGHYQPKGERLSAYVLKRFSESGINGKFIYAYDSETLDPNNLPENIILPSSPDYPKAIGSEPITDYPQSAGHFKEIRRIVTEAQTMKDTNSTTKTSFSNDSLEPIKPTLISWRYTGRFDANQQTIQLMLKHGVAVVERIGKWRDDLVHLLRNPSDEYIRTFLDSAWDAFIKSSLPPNAHFATELEKAEWHEQMAQFPVPRIDKAAIGISQGVGDTIHFVTHPVDAIEMAVAFTRDFAVLTAFNGTNWAFSETEMAQQQLEMLKFMPKIYQNANVNLETAADMIAHDIITIANAPFEEQVRMISRLMTNLYCAHKAMHSIEHAVNHAKSKRSSWLKKNQTLLTNAGESIIDAEMVTDVLQAEVMMLHEGIPVLDEAAKVLDVPLKITDKINAINEAVEVEHEEGKENHPTTTDPINTPTHPEPVKTNDKPLTLSTPGNSLFSRRHLTIEEIANRLDMNRKADPVLPGFEGDEPLPVSKNSVGSKKILTLDDLREHYCLPKTGPCAFKAKVDSHGNVIIERNKYGCFIDFYDNMWKFSFGNPLGKDYIPGHWDVVLSQAGLEKLKKYNEYAERHNKKFPQDQKRLFVFRENKYGIGFYVNVVAENETNLKLFSGPGFPHH